MVVLHIVLRMLSTQASKVCKNAFSVHFFGGTLSARPWHIEVGRALASDLPTFVTSIDVYSLEVPF